MTQQIVVLAAGKGTRMGADVPKVLLPLHEEPVIAHLLNEIKTIPQDTAPIIVVGFQEQLVKDTLGSEYIYVTQFDQKGTAHAVLSCKGTVTANNFIVLYGDMPFTSKESVEELIGLHTKNSAKISMFTSTLPNFENEYEHFIGFGRIIRDEENNIVKIQEHKDCDEDQKKITEVNPGIYMFNTEWLWKQLEKIGDHNAQHEFYLTDIVEMAIRDNQTVFSLPIPAEEIYGINTPEHLVLARKLVN
jgi:bifunctional N-acetylglucosamine-1-phosphate-uridyltransferase/glucosamine-1-phosphate-acetyltransferase GlmU-like protein